MSETRCGFVAIIGAPNAGKSTLINALIGEKVSIVTRKAQTTRSVVRGVLTRGQAQIVFVDGGFAAAEALVMRAWGDRITADAEPARDAKTAVQEWAQSRALGPPRYEEVERSGPAHAPHFVMRVVLEGFEPELGAASSKRAAEQAAAQAFLDRRGGS